MDRCGELICLFTMSGRIYLIREYVQCAPFAAPLPLLNAKSGRPRVVFPPLNPNANPPSVASVSPSAVPAPPSPLGNTHKVRPGSLLRPLGFRRHPD
jgi:hypothetical protein